MSLNSLNGSGMNPQVFGDVLNVAKDSLSVVADQLNNQSNGQLGSSSDSLNLQGGNSQNGYGQGGYGQGNGSGTIQSDFGKGLGDFQNVLSDLYGNNGQSDSGLGGGQSTGLGGGQSNNLQNLEEQVGLGFLTQGAQNNNQNAITAGLDLLQAALSDNGGSDGTGSTGSGSLGGSNNNSSQQLLAAVLQALTGGGQGTGNTTNAPGSDPYAPSPTPDYFSQSSSNTGTSQTATGLG